MAVTDKIERLKLGESLEKIVKNADYNFVSLFDSVAELDEDIKNVVQTSEAMIFKGTLGTGGTVTSLPTTHSAGDTYKVVTAGIYAGKNCNVGDLIICVKDSDDTSNIDTHWTVFEGNPDGSVTSSSTSSTDGHIAVFDGSSGKIVKDSGFTIKTSVPENAKFTDTTYDVATTTKDGLMSATDKSNLNQNTTARHSHSNKSVLDATTASYTTAEKTKLGNIEAGANKYVLPNAGTTLGGVKSGGDVTIQDGVITVASVGGKTADEIGKVKDVTVNGTSVLGSDGVANIVITVEDLKAGYASISSSSLVDCTVDGTTYKAIKVADTDTALEVYNSAGNKILTHTVRKDGYLYICVGTTAIACTLRKVDGNSIGGGGGGSRVLLMKGNGVQVTPNTGNVCYTHTSSLVGKKLAVTFGNHSNTSWQKEVCFVLRRVNDTNNYGAWFIAEFSSESSELKFKRINFSLQSETELKVFANSLKTDGTSDTNDTYLAVYSIYEIIE